MENGFHLKLLDMVQVEWGGQTVRGFESQKAIALLCYLVVTDHPVWRSQLADMFWPDKSEQRGRGNLSRVLSGLRSLLPGCVQADHRVDLLRTARRTLGRRIPTAGAYAPGQPGRLCRRGRALLR